MEEKQMDIASMEKTCRAVRRDIINMTADAASGHPGGSLSAVEIITTLFFGKMNIHLFFLHTISKL